MPSNKRIVPNVVASNVLVDAEVPPEGADGQFSVHGGGGGATTPGVLTSPAIVGIEMAAVRHKTEIKRFMGEAPFLKVLKRVRIPLLT